MNTPPTKLTVRISWLGMMNYLGALLTTGWVLYLMYGTAGTLYTLLALLVFGVILRFGASPLFALSASILYFHFDAFGLWLPLLAFVVATASFLNDLRRYRAGQQSR
jgi:hypothetical protein